MSRTTRIAGAVLIGLLPGGVLVLGAIWLRQRLSPAGRLDRLLRRVRQLQRQGKIPTEATNEQRASFAYGNVALSYPDGKCPITRAEVGAIAATLPPKPSR